MKTKLLSVLALAAAALASQHAMAADGTITFTGSITASTCTINGGTKDFAVPMPTVPATSLATAGAPSGTTPFTIALTSCTPVTGTVHTYFESGVTTDTATGNLKLDAGGATNVQIQLANASDGSSIKAGFADASQNSKTAALTAGAGTLQYVARYVAVNGAAVAGPANSSVKYTISYQ